MKHTWMIVVLMCVAASGCKKKTDDTGASGAKPVAASGVAAAADCDKLAEKTSAQSMEMTPPGTPDDQRARLKAIADEAGKAIATHCKTDAWTADAVACGLSAKNPAKECDGKLTADQKSKMEAEVQAIFSKGAAALTPTAPAAGGTEPAAGTAPAGGGTEPAAGTAPAGGGTEPAAGSAAGSAPATP